MGSGRSVLLSPRHFELHPIGAGILQAGENFAAHAGHAHRIGRVVAAGRVGQERVTAEVEVVEDVLAAAVVEALAADGDGDAVRARRGPATCCIVSNVSYLPVPTMRRL